MTVLMFDSIQSNIPANAQAVAGYVGGRWPTWFTFVREFPHLASEGRVVSIAINAGEKARFLDCEAGDATPSQAPGWFKSNADHSHGKPGIYCSASVSNDVISTMERAGHKRSDFLLWSAHYTKTEHICGPHTCGYPQADGTQYTDVAHGINLDESAVNDYWFEIVRPPAPYHIDRFANSAFPAPKQWFNGKHSNLAKLAGADHKINERDTVAAFRKLNEHPAKNGGALHVHRQALVFLRKRVWTVAHDQKVGGAPSWGVDWRGWRWQELAHMTEGVKQEW